MNAVKSNLAAFAEVIDQSKPLLNCIGEDQQALLKAAGAKFSFASDLKKHIEKTHEVNVSRTRIHAFLGLERF